MSFTPVFGLQLLNFILDVSLQPLKFVGHMSFILHVNMSLMFPRQRSLVAAMSFLIVQVDNVGDTCVEPVFWPSPV